MTLTLELPQDLETELSAEAASLGLSLPDYALRILAAGRPPTPRPINGHDLVAYWQSQGLIGTRTDVTDPEQHARDLRARAERRTQE